MTESRYLCANYVRYQASHPMRYINRSIGAVIVAGVLFLCYKAGKIDLMRELIRSPQVYQNGKYYRIEAVLDSPLKRYGLDDIEFETN